MFGILLTLLILDGLLMVVIVLLQSGKGGGLAAMGGGGGMGMGTDSFIGGRQAATLLTKATWTMGAIFLVLSLLLSILSSSGGQAPESVLQGEFQPAVPTQPTPILPGLQQGAEAPAAGAADAATGDQGAAGIPPAGGGEAGATGESGSGGGETGTGEVGGSGGGS